MRKIAIAALMLVACDAGGAPGDDGCPDAELAGGWFPVGEQPGVYVVEIAQGETHLAAGFTIAAAEPTPALARDVRAFVEGAELTAARAGLLLSGSVEAAKLQLEKDAGRVRLPLRTRIRDLLVFSEHDLLRDPPFSRLKSCSHRGSARNAAKSGLMLRTPNDATGGWAKTSSSRPRCT